MPSTDPNPCYGSAMPTALAIAAPGRLEATVAALERSGARVVGGATPEDAPARLADQALLDLLLADLTGLPPATVEALLPSLSAAGADGRVRLVARIEKEQIDRVAGTLTGATTTLLCAASPAEEAAALAMAAVPPGQLLNDASRDSESARLARLNEEVARIADTLARLTRSSAAGENEPAADRPLGAAALPAVDAATVRAAIRARRLRDQFFKRELFGDPAWDILLDLFAAELEQLRVSVSSLCIAAAVPPTTALRWITSMTQSGLLRRCADPIDRRRAFMALDPDASLSMRRYFGSLQRIWAPVP